MGEIGILMMFPPHLILANHFNEKGFSVSVKISRGKQGGEGLKNGGHQAYYLDISDVFDRFEMNKKLFLSRHNFSFPFPFPPRPSRLPFFSPFSKQKKTFV